MELPAEVEVEVNNETVSEMVVHLPGLQRRTCAPTEAGLEAMPEVEVGEEVDRRAYGMQK